MTAPVPEAAPIPADDAVDTVAGILASNAGRKYVISSDLELAEEIVVAIADREARFSLPNSRGEPIPADVLADRLRGMMRMAASSEDGFNRLTPAACRLLTRIHEALAHQASQEERIREDGPAPDVAEALRNAETTLLRYCNEAQAGRYPSDAREFERRVDTAFRSIRARLRGGAS